MHRCPECQRFSVEYDPSIGAERCLWRECLWVNAKGIDLTRQRYQYNFKEFRAALKQKPGIAV